MRSLHPALLMLVILECADVLQTDVACVSARVWAQRIRTPRPQVVRKTHDVEITAAPNIKVRIKNPPARFDQKGQLLKYSDDELKELKGDSPEEKKLPGYK